MFFFERCALYSVGQILYMLLDKSRKVVPVRVVEQVIRKSIDGEEVSYVVLLPSKDKSKIDLSKIDGRPFTSPEEVRKVMMKNASDAIDRMIETSRQISKSAFGSNPEPVNDLESETGSLLNSTRSSKGVNESLITTVDLGNGVKGNIDMSSIIG